MIAARVESRSTMGAGLARAIIGAASAVCAHVACSVNAAGETPAYADVAALMAAQCTVCHSGPAAPLGLRLDSLQGIKAGSSRGPVAQAGNSRDSELVRRLRGTSNPRMPLTGPPWMADDDVTRIARWIDAGMPAGEAIPAAAALPSLPAPGEPATFAHVERIFLQRCAKCHKDNGVMGAAPEGLRLDNLPAILRGNERAVVIPGNAAASKLLRRIKGYEFPRMPFDGPPWLDAADVELLERWINEGARDAQGVPATLPVGREVRLEGVLQPGWRLNDLVLDIGPGTRLKKAPAPGDYVRVRGRVAADGRIAVTRLRRR